jgi:hypothetical protein
METGVKNHLAADDRLNRKLARFLKGARFRYKAAFEKIGFAVDRNPERLRLSIRILPGKGHDWENLLSQTSAYAHQIAFTWLNPRKIHVGARLDKIDRLSESVGARLANGKGVFWAGMCSKSSSRHNPAMILKKANFDNRDGGK